MNHKLNSAQYFFHNPLCEKYDIKPIIVAKPESFQLLLAKKDSPISEMLSEIDIQASPSNVLFAKYRTIYLTKENIDLLKFENTPKSIHQAHVYKLKSISYNDYHEFIMELSVDCIKNNVNIASYDISFQEMVCFPHVKESYNDNLLTILKKLIQSTNNPEQKYRQLLNFNRFTQRLNKFHPNHSLYDYLEDNPTHLRDEDNLALNYRLELLSAKVEWMIQDPKNKNQDDYEELLKIIKNIHQSFDKFSFKKENNIFNSDRLIQNLEILSFFDKYPDIISHFYNVGESINIFDNIFSEQIDYPYNACFSFSKDKLLKSLEPNQTSTYLAYVCTELFQNILETANLYFKHDNVFVEFNSQKNKNKKDNEIYQAFIQSNQPIDIEEFKNFFKEAILAYKNTAENDFNPKLVHPIFHNNVIDKIVPINSQHKQKYTKF